MITEQAAWVSGLGLTIDLRLDGFAATMSLIVASVGVAVLVYATRYFAPMPGTSAVWPGCWCCSPGRCSASSKPTT